MSYMRRQLICSEALIGTNLLGMLIERYKRPLLFLRPGFWRKTRHGYSVRIELPVWRPVSFRLDSIIHERLLDTHRCRYVQSTARLKISRNSIRNVVRYEQGMSSRCSRIRASNRVVLLWNPVVDPAIILELRMRSNFLSPEIIR